MRVDLLNFTVNVNFREDPVDTLLQICNYRYTCKASYEPVNKEHTAWH